MSTSFALDIPEILFQIVFHLRRKRKNLLSIALTSRSFSKVALHFLWDKLLTPQPIFNLIPGFQRTEGTLDSSALIPLSSCDRFNFYRHRVRFLDWIDILGGSYDPLLVLQIASLPDGLFPRLQKLIISSPLGSPYMEPFLALFSSLMRAPTCVDVSLRFSSDPTMSTAAITPLLTILPSHLPRMQRLSLSHIPLPERVVDGILNECRSLTRLDLRAANIGVQTFRVLATLNSLQSLSLQTSQDSPLPLDFPDLTAPPSIALSQLTSLKLEMRLDWTARALQMVSSVMLARTEVIFTGSWGIGSGNPIFSKYLSFCLDCIARSAHHLTFLTVTMYDIPIITTPSECIAHFFNMPLLTYLDFSTPKIVYTAEDIDKMASGWPNIEILILRAEREVWPSDLFPPLNSIYAFARHCPRLRFLEILVTDESTARVYEPEGRAPVGIAQSPVDSHQLEHLDLSFSHLTTPSEVWKLVETVFPKLKMFKAANNTVENYVQSSLFRVSRQ